MNLKPPTADEWAALSAREAHRLPKKATFKVIGDGGADVRLPVALGHPSGACELPEGAQKKPAWDTLVALEVGALKVEPPEIRRSLAVDCVLWPPPAELEEWFDRWPGLPSRILEEVYQQIAAVKELARAPRDGEAPPVALRPVLASFPRAVWRVVTVPGDELALAIQSPDGTPWGFFVQELKAPGAAAGLLARQMASSCIVGAVRKDGAAVPAAEVLRLWPGVALLAMNVISVLIGLAAEVERDW
jgi:hypothetical protein